MKRSKQKKELKTLNWEPKVIDGGKILTVPRIGLKDNRPPEGEDWLSELPLGTCFLCKDQMEPGGVILHQYHIVRRFTVGNLSPTKLLDNTGKNHIRFWVDPVTFSQRHLKYAVVGVNERTSEDVDVDENGDD